MAEERPWIMVPMGQSSQLKLDLNLQVAALFRAPESYFRPHLCLNGEDGIMVLEAIRRNPEEAKTEYWIHQFLDLSGDELWLNLCLEVYLDNFCWPTNIATLSPRQTSQAVKNLSEESRTVLLGKIQAWYFQHFLANVKKGLDAVSAQFERGHILLDDYREGRIFDIHSKRNVPYTECRVVGEELYWKFLSAGTCFEAMAGGNDEFSKADNLIATARSRQKAAVEGFLGAMGSRR